MRLSSTFGVFFDKIFLEVLKIRFSELLTDLRKEYNLSQMQLKQLNKGENGGFLRENGQKRLVFLILPAGSPWAKSIFSLPARRAFSRNLFFEFLL